MACGLALGYAFPDCDVNQLVARKTCEFCKFIGNIVFVAYLGHGIIERVIIRSGLPNRLV